MTTRSLAVAIAACLALAATSLLMAHEPVYDAWAWLVWGRELAQLGLDTSSGPSFKPLPVAITALLSPAGDAAPELWLVLTRGAWLLALVLAAGLAHRLTGGLDRRLRSAAALVAAASLLLLADSFTSWPRQGLAGMSEPLLVALVLGAVAAGLEGRTRLALGLAGLAALVRPEVWPLLGAYGLWRWREEPALRPWIAGVAVAVPALWIAPDVLAGGGASAGERAVRGGGAPLHEFGEVFGRVAAMPLAAAWPLALLAVVARPRERTLVILGAGVLAWITVVAAMAAAGFPGLPRFMAPAAAVAGVLAGVGFARLLTLASRHRLAAGAAAGLGLLVAVQLPGRAAELPRALRDNARVARAHDSLRAVTRSIGSDALLRCGALATSDVLTRTALAWDLRAPIRRVVSFGLPPSDSGAFVTGARSARELRRYRWPGARLLGARGAWRVYSIDCPPNAAAGSAATAAGRSAGVSGARR